MFYGEIKNNDIANGDGVRVSLFVSGCRNHCEGCFQKRTWDFNYGKEFTKETEDKIIELLKPNYISGLSILGGEPFEEENQKALTPFLKRIKKNYPNKNIWCWTGYIYKTDILSPKGKKRCDVTDELLSYIDILVDGPFIESKKNITLKFRGSENQNIINLGNL